MRSTLACMTRVAKFQSAICAPRHRDGNCARGKTLPILCHQRAMIIIMLHDDGDVAAVMVVKRRLLVGRTSPAGVGGNSLDDTPLILHKCVYSTRHHPGHKQQIACATGV